MSFPCSCWHYTRHRYQVGACTHVRLLNSPICSIASILCSILICLLFLTFPFFLQSMTLTSSPRCSELQVNPRPTGCTIFFISLIIHLLEHSTLHFSSFPSSSNDNFRLLMFICFLNPVIHFPGCSFFFFRDRTINFLSSACTLILASGQISNTALMASCITREIEVDNIKVEILTKGDSARYLGQMIIFQQQETTEIRNRIRAAWATFHKYRQELTSKNHLLKHRLRLFDAVITPTICYASRTWTPTRMIQSTQRKMLRLIIQTKRRYKKIVKHKEKTNEENDTNDMSSTGDESEDGQSSNTHKDQDSDDTEE